MSISTNPEHYEAFKWCTENRVKVYPKIKVAHSSGKLYDKNEYMQNIWEFYLFLYNKLKNVSN